MYAINNKLIVLSSKREEKSSGGVILPETIQGAVRSGRVFDMGRDVDQRISQDSQVYFNKNDGINFEINGVEYTSISDTAILAVVPNK